MFSVFLPTDEALRRRHAALVTAPFTYAEVGATASFPPVIPLGYRACHSTCLLGHGPAAFAAAKQALTQWEHFRLGWATARPADTPTRTGEVISILAYTFGLWSCNCCRIVCEIDETTGDLVRFGFIYGTLPSHMGQGEERFLIEWNRTTGEVFYQIDSFSRPRHILARLFYPVMRGQQDRFGRDSGKAMQKAVAAILARATVSPAGV